MHGNTVSLAVTIAGLTMLTIAPFAWGQSAAAPAYPVKPVRIINPVAPGGNQDIVARAYAEQLGKSLGQPFVVESRPGANAIIGTRYVRSAAADGYTLLAISNTFVRTPLLVKDAGYDAQKEFASISQTSDVPLVLVITPTLPVRDIKEFIALAKRRPGEISSGSSGRGSTGHVAAERFSRQAGIRLLHVQYKGAAPAVIDLIGGHIMLRFDQASTSIAHIRSGKLRALGVTSRKRATLLPNVPTIDEAGLPGFEDTTFNGLMAPAGTPQIILERLRAEVAKIATLGEVQKRYRELGIELLASNSTDEFAAFLRKHIEDFSKLAREADLIEK